MKNRFELFVALRYLRSKRKEVFISIITVISVLAVALSVVVLNMVLAIMTGFEAELQSKLIDANAHVVVREYGSNLQQWEAVAEKVKAVEGVVEAFPFTYNQAMLSVEGGAHGIIIRGVHDSPTARKKLEKLLADGYTEDSLFGEHTLVVERPDGGQDTIVLPPMVVGAALKRSLHLFSNKPVTVFAPRFSASPQGLIPKLRRFVIGGIYSSGLMEYESGLAYVRMSDAQNFFGMGSSVSGLEIVVEDVFKAKEVAERVDQALKGLPVSYYVTDWTVPNQPLWEAIRLEKRVYFIVLLLLILIASFTIVSTLVMMVMEKSKDIAILKSMGASNHLVLKIFLLQGICIGAVGTIVGTVLGLLGCIGLREFGFPINPIVFSMDTVPVYLELGNFVVVAVAAFFITSLAGVYPARRAAKLRPAEILRFE
jgi:lipoprotein-releasing system permease protein